MSAGYFVPMVMVVFFGGQYC